MIEKQNQYSILIVEDDAATQSMLRMLFQSDGARVQTAEDGLEAFSIVEQGKFDLILLDVIIPSLDGFSLLQKIRKSGVKTPIIMLTDQQKVDDKVKGLEFGADDYVAKPFSSRELLARAKVQLRRQLSNNDLVDPIITIGNLTINAQTREIFFAGESLISLTKTEFDLLLYLAKRKDEVVSHENLLVDVLHYQSSVVTKAVVMHIANIRRKLIKAGVVDIQLKAISGIGYRLIE